VLSRLFIADQMRHSPQIVYERPHLGLSRFLVGRSKNRRWMYRCHYVRGERGVYPLTPLAADTEVSPQECLCSSRAQADKNLRLHYPDLGVEPGTASLNFRITRLFVNAPFSALRGGPLEMFHHIGNVHRFMLDTSLRQRFMQKSSGWSDKKGWPLRSSCSPGCSPTSMIPVLVGPSPKTVWVAFFQRSQALQAAAASRRPAIVRGGDTRAAGRALPV
jgi:hypothetical protein